MFELGDAASVDGRRKGWFKDALKYVVPLWRCLSLLNFSSRDSLCIDNILQK